MRHKFASISALAVCFLVAVPAAQTDQCWTIRLQTQGCGAGCYSCIFSSNGHCWCTSEMCTGFPCDHTLDGPGCSPSGGCIGDGPGEARQPGDAPPLIAACPLPTPDDGRFPSDATQVLPSGRLGSDSANPARSVKAAMAGDGASARPGLPSRPKRRDAGRMRP